MLRKSHGQTIEGDNSVERLVEIRTVSRLAVFLIFVSQDISVLVLEKVRVNVI